MRKRFRNATKDGNLDGNIREGIQDLQKVEDGLSDENLGDIKEGLIDLYLECEKDPGRDQWNSISFVTLTPRKVLFHEMIIRRLIIKDMINLLSINELIGSSFMKSLYDFLISIIFLLG